MFSDYYDYVILGAGITGLSIARELVLGNTCASISIFEKEAQLGKHGSGRNSGVLHSGIYYPENTLKAKVCSKGAKLMAEYCDEHNLPIKRLGKVIVPIHNGDDNKLELLYKRAQSNKVDVQFINSNQLYKLEPEARTATGRALYSPNTAVIDPKAVLLNIERELHSNDVSVYYSSRITKVDPDNSAIFVKGKRIRYGKLYNATGQFSDQVAHHFGLAESYTILPFKGIYYRLDENAGLNINGLIYPVPDLNVPFLGVHTVKDIKDKIYFGPTAVPAFGRENYKGLEGVNLKDAIDISRHLVEQYIANKNGFRKFSNEEAGRYFKGNFTKAARAIVPNIKSEYLLPSSKVGIRAQLLDKKNKELVMDFVVKQKENTVHVLNAVSPAFTSAFEFSRYVIKQTK